MKNRMKKQNNFKVENIDLEGSKLIEASAGTGKTYSVAILVLRLVLERDIPVDKILMVTFTKAAAAELESRIRKFVRLAYKSVNGEEIKDIKIKEVIGDPDDEKKSRLKRAVRSLDNLSVMTINSFCQKTINEFTFETNQSFSFEIVKDDTFLFEELVNSFRREVVNAMEDYEWFKEINDYLRFDKMSEILRKSLAGKEFIDIDLDQQDDLNDNLRRLSETTAVVKEKIFSDFDAVKNAKVRKNARLAKNRETPGQFLPVFIQDCCLAKKYITEFAFLYEPYGRILGEAYEQVRHSFYTTFINSAKASIQKIKQEKGLISYDDQIRTVYNALENEDFIKKLAKEYRAVFIDEFQDTDKYQYEIFRKVFAEGSDNTEEKPVIFYIGDPKQSIYGWRRCGP
jgi:exodeoxyribonuclease V beta subunit